METLLESFKKIVDSYSETITSIDYKEVCKILRIDISKGYARTEVTSLLYENIREALTLHTDVSEKISRSKLLKLQTELVYRHVIDGDDPVVYLRVLKVINDSCRKDNNNYFPPFTDLDKWEMAIIACKNYNKFSPDTHGILFGDIRSDYPKDFDRAASAKKLVDMGCKIEIKDSRIDIVSGLEELVEELNEKIEFLGGITFIKVVFANLEHNKRYSKRFERYFITREAGGLSHDQKPQFPYGFLLNLALKYPEEKPITDKIDPILKEISELAIVITNGVYGVQHYNYWEYHFQSGETIIQFCTELALWDSLFTIPQCRPSTALEITDELFSFIPETDFQTAVGFTRQQLILVSNEINKTGSETNEPKIIYHSTICKKLKDIDKNTIQAILEFLAHPAGVNANYNLPSAYTEIDFFVAPLLKLGPTKFLLVNRSWCAPNYFEAAASKLRKKISDFDAKLGVELELFLQNKLKGKGITFSTGEYEVGGVAGECDLLVESDKAIVLIEFKKKVFTRKSKSGIDINILLDLADSVLSAQLQAGRTEIILREKGSITLKTKDGNKKVIDLNGRTVERVALTQLEFGAFQDRIITNTFLKSLLTHSFGTYSTDPNIVKKFSALNEKQKVWVEQYNKLHALDKDFAHFPFFNCWFIGLPQLLEVINISTDNNSFYETFRTTKHVTMGTLDWFREFDLATNRIA